MPKLLWKEWHEQAWKLGFGCVVLAAMALIGLRSRVLPDETMIMWVCFIGLLLLPILAVTGLIPAERAENSFESLLALPVHPRKILAAKTLMGMLLVALPLIAAGAVSFVVAANRELPTAAIVLHYVRFILSALCLFMWMLALTARLPNETRASLLSIGVLILWAMASGITGYLSPLTFIHRPGFFEVPYKLPVLILVQLAIAIVLWFWTSMRLVAPVEE